MYIGIMRKNANNGSKGEKTSGRQSTTFAMIAVRE